MLIWESKFFVLINARTILEIRDSMENYPLPARLFPFFLSFDRIPILRASQIMGWQCSLPTISLSSGLPFACPLASQAASLGSTLHPTLS
jgi:hypothetical protein